MTLPIAEAGNEVLVEHLRESCMEIGDRMIRTLS
jgi:hypothetical protein